MHAHSNLICRSTGAYHQRTDSCSSSTIFSRFSSSDRPLRLDMAPPPGAVQARLQSIVNRRQMGQRASGGGGKSRVGGGQRRWRRPGEKAAAGGGGSGSRVGGGHRRGRRPGAGVASAEAGKRWITALPGSVGSFPVVLNETGRAKVARAADQMPTTAVRLSHAGIY